MARLAVDATNLRDGGGLTHLIELLAHADPRASGFEQVVVWGGDQLEKLTAAPWLERRVVVSESDSYFQRTSWSSRHLPRSFEDAKCDLLFAPGGSFCRASVPYVSMSQNMLLYDDQERARFPWGWNRLRYNLLRNAQRRSFRHARGIVFLSHYAQQRITERFPFVSSKPQRVIYHGLSDRFRYADERCVGGDDSGPCVDRPIVLLYVSRVNYYKHQWNLIEAVNRCSAMGHKVQLRLVGREHSGLKSRMDQAIRQSPPGTVKLIGEIPYEEMELEYQNADVFVFASTCENMPNILVEAMGAGLPIASSDFGPMPEIIGDAGVFFDPTRVESIVEALTPLLERQSLRDAFGKKARVRSAEFDWNETAGQTFDFLRELLPR